MSEQNKSSSAKRKKLTRTLAAIFVFALIMGPGPGLYLINNYAASGGMILGIPALYAWAVFWFAVEAVIVVTAYLKIWTNEPE